MAEAAVGTAGLVVGGVSLTIQLLDGCVKGYQFFVAAVGMPDDCRYLHTRLQMEYSRLLDWRDVVGLTDHQANSPTLPDLVEANKLVIVAILTEIKFSMDKLAEFHGEYEELQPGQIVPSSQELSQRFSDLTFSHDKKDKERKYLRGFNHIAGAFVDAGGIIKHPRRLKWVALDHNAYKDMLDRFVVLNDHLEGLLHGQQMQVLQRTTQHTYLEMLQVRSDIDQLRQLFAAATLFQLQTAKQGTASSDIKALSARRKNDDDLASLVDFKAFKQTGSRMAKDAKPLVRHGSSAKSSAIRLEYSRIEQDLITSGEPSEPSSRPMEGRAISTYTPNSGDSADTVQNIWIEWKPYKPHVDSDTHSRIPLQHNVEEVEELITLLQSDKPSAFRTPQCLGYFDDNNPNSKHSFRFGIVYAAPTPTQHDQPSAVVSTLAEMIAENPKPSLTQRVKLANQIANYVLYLHAVNWLHEALRSDNITFFSDSDITEPYITGYDYARPVDNKDASRTGDERTVLRWQHLYVHPTYQDHHAKGTYRKTFDVYSLGILLLEILYWEFIEEIVGLDIAGDPGSIASVKDRVLGFGQDEGLMSAVEGDFGSRVSEAVKACLQGREAFGVGEKEDEMAPETGAKLQTGFTRLVVENLRGIDV